MALSGYYHPVPDCFIKCDQPFGLIHMELFDHFTVEGCDGLTFGQGLFPGLQHAFGALNFGLAGAEESFGQAVLIIIDLWTFIIFIRVLSAEFLKSLTCLNACLSSYRLVVYVCNNQKYIVIYFLY